MNPKIITIPKKEIIGLSAITQMGAHQDIPFLWKTFMPRKQEINNTVSKALIAMQIFSLQDDGQPKANYTIWACTEVNGFSKLPKGMETYTIPKGEYAVFVHKGMNASATYLQIMNEWLPTSGYEIDDRPHFQVMGDKYKNGSEASEEDFYVPVKSK